MTGNNIETENFYDILQNADGDLLFCIRARAGSPEKPQILYSGEDHALFYRRSDQTIILDYIHPGVREAFSKVSAVLVAEFSDSEEDENGKKSLEKGIVREYMASVRHVSKLPADLKDI